MNEPTPPEPDATTPDEDELVAAVLDGEATEHEQAAVEGDPRLRARLEVFAQVQARAALPDLPGDEVRDAAVERALASAAPEPGRAPAEPADLADGRLARDRRRRRLATALAAAAVLLVLVPLVAVTLLSGGREVDVASRDHTSEDAGEAASEPLAQESADAAAPPSTPPSEVPLFASVQELGDLGELESFAGLRAEVLTVLELDRQRAAASSPSGPGEEGGASSTTLAPTAGASTAADGEACASAISAADPTIGALTSTGTATLAGEPVLVLVYGDGSGGVLVVARADCTLVGRATL